MNIIAGTVLNPAAVITVQVFLSLSGRGLPLSPFHAVKDVRRVLSAVWQGVNQRNRPHGFIYLP